VLVVIIIDELCEAVKDCYFADLNVKTGSKECGFNTQSILTPTREPTS